VSKDFRAAVKSRMWGKAAAFAIPSLALNTYEEEITKAIFWH